MTKQEEYSIISLRTLTCTDGGEMKKLGKVLWFLAIALVCVAPFLVSFTLRSGVLRELRYMGSMILNWEFVRGFVSFVVAMCALLPFFCVVMWLTVNAGVKLEGWRRGVFIFLALVFFLGMTGLWVWGIIDLYRLDWSSLTPEETIGATFLPIFLIIFGILALALARPAIWAVRLLFGR